MLQHDHWIRKIFLAAAFIFVITLICAVNIRAILHSYYGFYEIDGLEENFTYQSLGFVESNYAVNDFLMYSGMETGYGFFAPNVASDFITIFSLYDERDSLIEEMNFVPLKNKESVMRIASAYTMFLEYSDTTNTLNHQKCDIFLKGLALKVLQSAPSVASSVTVRLYLYHHPTLEMLSDSAIADPQYFLVDMKNYSRNDFW